MFKPNTVIVLGAGASFEAGLPLGHDLKNKISALTKFKFENDRLVHGDGSFLDELNRFAAFRSRDGMHKIYMACQKISNGIGFVSSVDNFLEIHSEDADVQVCAKAAIASIISKGEQSSRLYVNQSNIYNRLSASALNGTWYQEFAHVLFERANVDSVAAALSQVKFVSFNYDRCLEWFLFQSLTALYAIDTRSAADVLKRAEIYHPYGDIGPVHWRGGPEGFFGRDISRSVVEVSKGLLTYTEGSPPEIVNEIRAVMQAAETIVFLGFGFHAQNMELLLPNEIDGSRKAKTIIGTGLGMSEEDLREVESRLDVAYSRSNGAGRKRAHINLVDLTCADFFRRFKRTLSI